MHNRGNFKLVVVVIVFVFVFVVVIVVVIVVVFTFWQTENNLENQTMHLSGTSPFLRHSLTLRPSSTTHFDFIMQSRTSRASCKYEGVKMVQNMRVVVYKCASGGQ